MIQSFLPGLTHCRFIAARRHAAEFGVGVTINQSPVVIERFDYDQVDHFIGFITSEHVCTDLPFGERCLKQTNDNELFVPNTKRNMIPTCIITLYSLLNACKVSTRKSIEAINYFATDASEAFDSIEKLIDTLHLDITKCRHLLENLK